MSDPVIESLQRLSPDPGRLNRDQLLFLAGLQTGRRTSGWRWLARLLLLTQAVTLWVLWPRPVLTPQTVTPPAEAVPAPLPDAPPSPRPPDLLAYDRFLGPPPGYDNLRGDTIVWTIGSLRRTE